VLPSRPEPDEVEGLFADRMHNEREARDAYDKAIALGSTNLYALGRLANILRRGTELFVTGRGPDRATLARVEQLLSRAASINHDQSREQANLGQFYLMDLRQPLEALCPLQRAVN
jgi:hypothetical protein